MSKLTNRQLISQMRSHKRLCGIASQKFNQDLPREHEQAAEAYVQAAFERWWDTWIEPDIAEIEKRLIKPRKAKLKKGVPAGRSYRHDRRSDVLLLVSEDSHLRHLTKDEFDKLYDATVNENENWDGEFVEPLQILDLMSNRYVRYGLAPSEN